MKPNNNSKHTQAKGILADSIFYRDLLDKITEAILLTDDKEKIIYANNASGLLFNEPAQNILGKPLSHYLPEQEKEEVCISIQGIPEKTCRLSQSKVKWDKTIARMYSLQEITGYKNSEILLSKRSKALTERVKELNALYKIARLTANKEIHPAEVLQKTTGVLSRSWQYPAITQARINWGNKSFKSKNYLSTPWCQSAEIIVNGKTAGNIEVGYQKEMPLADEGPFLKDERKLIDNVADKLGKYLEREDARKEIEFNAQLLNSIGDAVIYTDVNGIIKYWNKAAERIYGWKKEDALARNILEKMPAHAMKKADRNIMQAILKGKTWTGEFTVVNKGGHTFNILLTSAPLMDENNKVAGIIGVSRDITERKKAETASRDFAERLKNISQNLPGAIFQYKITPNGEMSLPFVSGATWDIYNHTAKELMDYPELTEEMVHPEDKQRYHDEIQKSFETLSPYQSVYRIITPEGEIKWIEVKSNPEKLENGDVIWTGVALNVTDFKKTEDLLRKSEQRFHDVAENIPGLVYQIKMTPDGEFEMPYISKSAGRIFKQDIKEINSDALFARVHPDDLSALVESSGRSAKDLSPWSQEFRVMSSEGKYLWVQGRSMPRRQEDMSTIWNGVMIDITDRKKVELKIRENEEKLQEAQQIAKMGNFELDLLTYRIRWSENFFKLLHIDIDDPEMKLGTFQNLIVPEERWKVKHYIRKTVDSRSSKTFDIKLQLKDQTVKYLQISGKPLMHENNEVTRIIGTAMDITRRKIHEIEVQEAREKAEESDRLKSIFLQTMSHELRTPLNAIIGFSDLMLNADSDPGQKQEFIPLINNSGKHLLSIIEDMFELSALETGQSKVVRDEIRLPEFFDDIIPGIEEYQHQIEKQHLELAYIPEQNNSGFVFESDKSKLSKVLTILLSNALKFTEKGKIEFGYEKLEKDLRFFVRDSGVGIPEEKHQLIFERFRQAEESPTRTFEGVGLGLSICKIIAELLHADIWVDSTVGEGSTFYFKLKDVLPENSPVKPEKQPENNQYSMLSGKNILVVEDESSNMKLLEIILRRKGFRIVKAASGMEAVELFSSNPSIDLVLMDLKMPVMSGFDATREIMKLKPGIPVIAITAYALEGDRQKAIQAGCVDYISKPVNSKILIQKIEQHLKN